MVPIALRVGELELLFTADTKQIERADKNVKSIGERIEKKPITAKVDADAKGALAGMDRVESAAKKLVSQDTSLKLDADISRAEKSLGRAQQRLADLEVRALGGLEVTADIRRAEAALSKVERSLSGLQSARTMIEVDADTIKAENELDGLASKAEAAGGEAGAEAGKSLEDTLVSALVAIPIAGGIILAGVAIGKAVSGAIQEGLQVEVGRDRLQALTGISEADALRLGRAAGEAYANVFGDSIEANMDTTRLALQFDIIDADTSTRSAQKVVEGLSGIADVLGEEVRPIAAAVTTLLNTGVAKSAENAFDILATGAREGVNRNEDLIDTFTEYPALFARLGLSGEEALGLINQGLEGGARNSDIAADALKEFQIRATDASTLSAEGFKALGLNAEDMTAKISRGGSEARDGLELVLTKLRETEDPVLRNAAAVALFGTQAEDLGEALFAMDLSTAVAQLDGVTGAAQLMFDTLADNDATKLEQAQRNIEVATDGMKGALAAAFADPLGEAADWISANRGPMLQFFQDLVNGALDFGHTLIDAAADGTEAFGVLVGGPLADVLDIVARITAVLGDVEGGKELDGLAEDMRGFKDESAEAADKIRGLHDDLDNTTDVFNKFTDGAKAMAFLNDASVRLAGSLDDVGVGADGALLSLDGVDVANVRASDSGRVLADQVRDSIIALQDEQVAASVAGESQETLAERYRAGTDALVGQLTQMGLTEEQARALIDTVLQTPPSATTAFSSNAQAEQAKAQALADRITTLPDGSVVIRANTDPATAAMTAFMRRWDGVSVNIRATGSGRLGSGLLGAAGGVVEFMAQGGMRGFSPMQSIAQVVPANTWRVVGDRGDVPESFIPIDGSARSMAILLETMRRMGVIPMATGGITASEPGVRTPDRSALVNIEVTTVQNEDPRVLSRIIGREMTNALAGS